MFLRRNKGGSDTTETKQNTGKTSGNQTPWIPLREEKQIQEIKDESENGPVIIFKHSTRCSISAMALDRLQRKYDGEAIGNAPMYFLDLISYRNVSNAIADEFGVLHQSPQILVVKDGKCIYDDSHMGIDFGMVASQVQQA